MYEEHFGLTAKPFQLSPDAEFFYPSTEHNRALAFLEYGLEQADGFIVITGDVGTGKTTLAQTLLKRLDSRELLVANVVTTAVDEDDLLYLVASSLGLRVKQQSKALLLRDIERLCAQQAREHRRTLLVIDEAQNLPPSSVEELRMLSNFNQDGKPLLQIFLLGQEEFRVTLLSEGFEQLRQRVIATYHLNPLNEDDTRTYVEHRLTHAGWQQFPRFADDAFPKIYELTAGVPRRINNLCDRTLLYAFLEDLRQIDASVLDNVAAEIGSEFMSGTPDSTPETRHSTTEVFDAPGQPLETMARVMFDKANVQQRLASLERAVDGLGSALRPELAEVKSEVSQLRMLMEAVLTELRNTREPLDPTDQINVKRLR